MKKIVLLFLLPLFSNELILSQTTAYEPNIQNISFSGKNIPWDFNVHFNYNEAGFNNIALQNGKHLTNNFFAIVNGEYSQRDGSRDLEKKDVELGFGFLLPDAQKTRINFLAGIGLGSIKHYEAKLGFLPDKGILVNGKYYKFFIQGNEGWLARRFERILSFRITGIKFSKYNETEVSIEGAKKKLSTEGRHYAVFAEPAATLRFGFEHFKLSSQIGFSFPISGRRSFDNNGLWLALGLHLSLPKS